MKASWLYSKHPITIDVDLATVIGMNGAIVLQQVNYWLHTKSGKEINGRYWVYNSYKKWQETNFPFWSEKTVKRIFTKLEDKGLLLTGNFNKYAFDRTKWYSVNETKLTELMSQAKGQNDPMRKGQNDPMRKGQNDPMRKGQNDPTNTRDYQRLNTENTTDKDNAQERSSVDDIPYKQIIDYLNKKTGKHYKPSSKANQRLINGRWHEGYTLDDFKKVIDNKCFEWEGTKMATYLRPETLFNATKFESYLNQNNVNEREPTSGGYEKYMQDNPSIEDIPDDELPF